MDVFVASSDGKAPPTTGLGVVPAVGGIDACVWSVRERGAIHVRVERVHVVLPRSACRARPRDGQASEQLFVVRVGKVRNDIGFAT